MNLKRQDLEMLMEYVNKEKPEKISIKTEENGFSTSFTFVDEEGRECKIVLHESTINTPPDLIKKMKLKTRVEKTK